MHQKWAQRILGDLQKSQLVEFLPRKKTVEIQTSPRPDEFVRYGRRSWLGADGNVIIERLCCSSLCWITFNSKVIKSFVLEPRSRYVFFVFRDSYVIYIWVMNILCTFHIFMFGNVTIIQVCKYYLLYAVVRKYLQDDIEKYGDT